MTAVVQPAQRCVAARVICDCAARLWLTRACLAAAAASAPRTRCCCHTGTEATWAQGAHIASDYLQRVRCIVRRVAISKEDLSKLALIAAPDEPDVFFLEVAPNTRAKAGAYNAVLEITRAELHVEAFKTHLGSKRGKLCWPASPHMSSTPSALSNDSCIFSHFAVYMVATSAL
jgi:hypothetical protein